MPSCDTCSQMCSNEALSSKSLTLHAAAPFMQVSYFRAHESNRLLEDVNDNPRLISICNLLQRKTDPTPYLMSHALTFWVSSLAGDCCSGGWAAERALSCACSNSTIPLKRAHEL
eukprot:6208172-Amphidinium_carterae.1